MRSMPLVGASLLTVALSLAGCGEDSNRPAPTTTAPAPEATAPAQPTAYDEARARTVVKHYADLALAIFSDAHQGALKLQEAVEGLLAEPTQANLEAARQAWREARVPYMQSEVLRFGNPVVDDWEGQVNAWPLDEGLIDYVAEDYQHALGNPAASANIIANPQIQLGDQTLDARELTPQLLASLNELNGGEANVTTGYHAIEFLLWGQDLNGTGPGAGNRPVSDFVIGEDCTGGNCERRRAYLQAVTQLLVDDLTEMVCQWQPDADNYRAELLAEPVENGLRKMFFGMGSLSLGELAGERMKVSLEANSTEDEHDCFSDTTHFSHFYNGKGIRNIYLGEYRRRDGSLLQGPSLSELVAAADANADQALRKALDATQARLQALVDSAEEGQHFDQLIAAENLEGQKLVRDAIAALVAQTADIERAAKAIGLTDLNPDSADHQF